MKRRPPRSTRPDTLFPYPTLFDDDPRPPGAAVTAPGGDGVGNGIGIVVRHGLSIAAREPHSVMRAGVDQRVVENAVAGLRQRGEQSDIGENGRASWREGMWRYR